MKEELNMYFLNNVSDGTFQRRFVKSSVSRGKNLTNPGDLDQ